MIRYDVMR